MIDKPETIRAFLEEEGNLLVVTHIFPDGDAIGSLLAFSEMLDQMKIEHIIAVDDECPRKYNFLPGYEKIRGLGNDPLETVVDRIVILDAGALPRIGVAQQYIGESTRILNIDHHFTGESYGHVNHVDIEASATSEILYGLCADLGCEIDKQVATNLYVGILTDTGRFRFSNTTESVLKICGDLISKGADPGWITENVYFKMPFELVQALGRALLTIELRFDGLACLLQLDRGHYKVETEGFVDYAISIKGVALAAFISEMESDVYKVSLRSRCAIDVSRIAVKFGGGGHTKAAGFRYQGSKMELIDKLFDELKRQIDAHGLHPGDDFPVMYDKVSDEAVERSINGLNQ